MLKAESVLIMLILDLDTRLTLPLVMESHVLRIEDFLLWQILEYQMVSSATSMVMCTVDVKMESMPGAQVAL